jgi:3-oxoacyl-[acyl-carrier protein] reductase
MHIDLSGKVAVVTGAGRGIGRVIAETFADEGMVVVGTDVRDELLESLSDDPTGKRALTPYNCDVRDADSVARLADTVLERFGRVDVLVNNAGVGFGAGPVESTTEEAWDANLDVNLKGTFLTCRAFAPAMKAQRSGRILNAASFAAIIPSVGSAAYAASKAGVQSFTRVLAGELGPYNVTVNCYAPGMIPTELNHFADAPAERQERLLDTLTLRRWGDPRDVAHLLCFLASDYAAYITGTMIDVSGGKFATQIPRAAYERAAAAGDYAWEE